jgi:hypothetical protein
MGGPRRVHADLPRAGRVTLRRQPAAGRDVLHLLHATPALRGNLRGANIQPIQDLVTLSDVAVDLVPEAEVAAVRLAPEGVVLPHAVEAGRLRFTVPKVRGHQMVEIAYR